MSKILSACLIILVAFSIGCVGSNDENAPGHVTDNIMVFAKENIASSFLQGGQNVTDITVVNRGDKDTPARNVHVELYDRADLTIQEVICSKGELIDKDGDVISCDAAPVSDCREYVRTRGPVGCLLDEMPYGDSIQVKYFLVAPEFTHKKDVSGGEVGYSVTFDYSMSSRVQIPVTTRAETVSGALTTASVEFSTQATPVKPLVTIGTDKALVGVPFSMTLQFDDIGNGGKVSGNKIDRLNVFLDLPSGMIIDPSRKDSCGFESGLKNENNEFFVPKSDVIFNNYKSQLFRCWFVYNGDLGGAPLTTVGIDLMVTNFTYEYRRTAPVTLYAVK